MSNPSIDRIAREDAHAHICRAHMSSSERGKRQRFSCRVTHAETIVAVVVRRPFCWLQPHSQKKRAGVSSRVPSLPRAHTLMSAHNALFTASSPASLLVMQRNSFFHFRPDKNVRHAKNHRTRTLTRTFGNNRTFSIFAERSAYSPNTGYIF